MPEKDMFLYCQFCVKAKLDSRLEVSISSDAELIVKCKTHNITVLRTNDLEGTAQKIYSRGCALCEHEQGHGGH